MPAKRERAAVVDEFGELERQVALLKPTLDRHAALKKEIASWYEFHSAGAAFTEAGKRYEVQISAKAKVRTITDKTKLFTALGKGRFIDLAKISLEAIDRLIPRLHHPAFLSEEQTGNRAVRAVARCAVREAKAA